MSNLGPCCTSWRTLIMTRNSASHESRIEQAYRRFKGSGHGDAALLYNGQRVKHYALTDPKEFFAEMTEAYIGSNDFFPFNGAELLTAEPEVFQLMLDISGTG